MKTLLGIARRYLFAKKSSNAINVIIWVCITGIGVGSGAIILVLSVFNGLTNFIEGLFAGIDPDIKVVAAAGQTFEESEAVYESLLNYAEIASISRTLEGKVWLEYRENETVAILKGVESDFLKVNPLDTFLVSGDYTFAPRNGTYQAVLGIEIAHRLNADLVNKSQPITDIPPIRVSYLPQDASTFNPLNDLQTQYVYPSGVFTIQKEYDETYMVTDLSFVRELFDLKNHISAYEIRLNDIKDAEWVKEDLQRLVGDKYQVLTWYEQHQTLYRVMKNEKYISYLILVLMLAIAAVNIVGSLQMIVYEKTRDIAVLKSIGATSSMIRKIFQYTGLMVGGIGGLIGVFIALVTGLAQKYLGIVRLQGGESFRVKAFPIDLLWDDFVLVFFTVLLLAAIASLYPSRRAAKVKVVEGLRQ